MASPKSFLKKAGSEWVCRECGHPLGDDKGAAGVLMIQHMENHGAVADPPRSRTGGSGGSGGGDLFGAALDVIDVILGG